MGSTESVLMPWVRVSYLFPDTIAAPRNTEPVMLFRCVLLSLLLSAHSVASAIANIESQRPGPPPEGWSGHLELTASGKSGDVEEDRYGVGGRLGYRVDRNIVFGMLSAAEARSQGVKTADESFAHLRWMHQRSERIALEGFVQFQENAFASLLSRYLAGAGTRIQLMSSPDRYEVYTGLGVFREWEHTDLGTFRERERRWRFNSYWTYKHQLNEQVSWFGTLYFQPDLSDQSDYRMLFDTGLRVRLTGSLHLRLSYNLRHDSDPPRNLLATPVIDRQKTNSQYLTAFLYEF
jgi:putative salt-induced outer membrane protein YdiY